VVPLRKRRKVPRRADGRRRIVTALLLAVGIGIVVHIGTRPRLLSKDESVSPGETRAGLESWSDSAGREELHSRRLDRLASGCASASLRRREAVLDSFPTWSDDVLALVACRRIRQGFTADQLRAAWGSPARVIPDLSGIRPIEEWDYGLHSVLIWDGAIRSWE
jgi:hypothetical protein